MRLPKRTPIACYDAKIKAAKNEEGGSCKRSVKHGYVLEIGLLGGDLNVLDTYLHEVFSASMREKGCLFFSARGCEMVVAEHQQMAETMHDMARAVLALWRVNGRR